MTHGEIEEEKLLQDLQKVAEEVGKTPKYSEYKELGEYHPETFINRFGSYNKALRKAELTPRVGITQSEIVKDVGRVAKELGHVPDTREYREHGVSTPRTASRKIGGWEEVIRLANVRQMKAVEVEEE